MSEIIEKFDQNFITYVQKIAREGMYNAAVGFATMLGERLTVTEPVLKIIPYSEIPDLLGGLEAEAVGIYLRAEGSIPSQFMLILPFQKAKELVDLLMDQPEGTTQQLGSLERSALAEVGNLTGTFFMNTVATLTHTELRPTPPAVMVDMVGAIMDIIVATSGEVGENVMMLQASFELNNRQVQADLWIIPDATSLNQFVPRSKA
ncbi:MAG TPA: chemotaxis protein CheC [Anaerolineaceae bacterium]|nr:chemotaxis protein CheC [Anaerolineaceae bacterium]